MEGLYYVFISGLLQLKLRLATALPPLHAMPPHTLDKIDYEYEEKKLKKELDAEQKVVRDRAMFNWNALSIK
jgi:hypothetical protein